MSIHIKCPRPRPHPALLNSGSLASPRYIQAYWPHSVEFRISAPAPLNSDSVPPPHCIHLIWWAVNSCFLFLFLFDSFSFFNCVFCEYSFNLASCQFLFLHIFYLHRKKNGKFCPPCHKSILHWFQTLHWLNDGWASNSFKKERECTLSRIQELISDCSLARW